MLREFFWVGKPRVVFAWSGLVIFVCHQLFKAYLKVALNDWYEHFYDTLQLSGVVSQFGSGDFGSGDAVEQWSQDGQRAVQNHLKQFATIVAPAIVIHPIASLIKNFWVLEWRLSLMKSYIASWNTSIAPIEGAAQRVHEDTQRFSVGVHGCISIVLEATLTLIVFCPVLYNLLPNLMTLAVVIATGGLMVSVLLGYKLVDLEVKNQVVEAQLRKQLVVLEIDPASITEKRSPIASFQAILKEIRRNYRNLYLNFSLLSTWLSAYEQLAILVPYMVAGGMLFAANPADRITLGKLVKLSNAFGKVFTSVNVISDNWLQVNEFRSVLVRLVEFENACYNDGDRARLGVMPTPTASADQDVELRPPPPRVRPPPHNAQEVLAIVPELTVVVADGAL